MQSITLFGYAFPLLALLVAAPGCGADDGATVEKSETIPSFCYEVSDDSRSLCSPRQAVSCFAESERIRREIPRSCVEREFIASSETGTAYAKYCC